MQDDPIDFENSHPDMEKIIESDKLLPVTKSVAKMLMRNPYTSLGRFFKKLSNENLEILMEIIDEGDSEFNERVPITHELDIYQTKAADGNRVASFLALCRLKTKLDQPGQGPTDILVQTALISRGRGQR